jgi:LuxR family maltose regulon positive regulatory protein
MLLHPSSIEALLTLLINDLLRTPPRDSLVLVLDNYQVITNGFIHQALSFFLAHLPSWMHLVLATREDPPLPLAHLRGCSDLLELRASDLRFTPEEAETFLVDVMRLPLSQQESSLLHTRTEGWITGLQLAAFSLQDREDLSTFIMAFSGSHHYIVDYLLEEVLKRQSPVVQDFLLQTCILDRLSAPLCDAIRQQEGSQALLDYLERSNLFLVALDDTGQWYRYHRLFAEALRQQLHHVAPTLVVLLYQRADQWYKQQEGFVEIASSVQHPPLLQLESLTAREHEVLQLLLSGASNQEIAQRLTLSRNTAKKHVLNICRKFDVRSRAQVIVKMSVFPRS